MSAAARNVLTEFVLERMELEPIAKRIELLRSLAIFNVSGSPKEREELHALADELEQIERKHRQLVLDFKRRAL